MKICNECGEKCDECVCNQCPDCGIDIDETNSDAHPVYTERYCLTCLAIVYEERIEEDQIELNAIRTKLGLSNGN